MLVVHSFERNLSNSSLISNFLFEIQDNYYDELHSILRGSIMKSTQSTFIQVIDRLRKNIFNNHHSLLASLLTQNVKEFCKNYLFYFKYISAAQIHPAFFFHKESYSLRTLC